jgi:hypothetical protein
MPIRLSDKVPPLEPDARPGAPLQGKIGGSRAFFIAVRSSSGSAK